MHKGFDPLSVEFLANPYAAPKTLPRKEPVFYAPSLDYLVEAQLARGLTTPAPRAP